MPILQTLTVKQLHKKVTDESDDISVDVIVSDLPFGKRSGSKADNKVLYPQTLLGNNFYLSYLLTFYQLISAPKPIYFH